MRPTSFKMEIALVALFLHFTMFTVKAYQIVTRQSYITSWDYFNFSLTLINLHSMALWVWFKVYAGSEIHLCKWRFGCLNIFWEFMKLPYKYWIILNLWKDQIRMKLFWLGQLELIFPICSVTAKIWSSEISWKGNITHPLISLSKLHFWAGLFSSSISQLCW